MVLLPAVSLEHIGIASREPATPLTDALGEQELRGKLMPSGVTVAHFGPDDRLELLWPGPDGSPIDNFLERRGPGLHHIALRVDLPLGPLVETLHSIGIRTAGQIERGADGRASVFLHPSSMGGVLVELVEGERGDV